MLSQISKKLAKLSKRFRRARVGHSRNPRSPQILQEAKGAMTRRILVHRESNMPSSSRTSPTTGRSRLNESCERVELDTAFYDEEGDTDSWDPSTRSERIDGLEAASDQPRTRRPLDLPTVCPTPMKCRRDIDYRLLSCPVHSNLFHDGSPLPSRADLRERDEQDAEQDIRNRSRGRDSRSPNLRENQRQSPGSDIGERDEGHRSSSARAARRRLTERVRWLIGRQYTDDHQDTFDTYGFRPYRTPWWRREMTDEEWREIVEHSFVDAEARIDAQIAFRAGLQERDLYTTEAEPLRLAQIDHWLGDNRGQQDQRPRDDRHHASWTRRRWQALAARLARDNRKGIEERSWRG